VTATRPPHIESDIETLAAPVPMIVPARLSQLRFLVSAATAKRQFGSIALRHELPADIHQSLHVLHIRFLGAADSIGIG